MQYRQVGNTGVEVSALGFGTMRFTGAQNAIEVIERGLALGVTYFDVGDAYSWESPEENAATWVGRAVRGRPRESLVLSGKAQVRPGDAPHQRVESGIGVRNRDEMWRSIENSLSRVGVDHFDFYQLWDTSSQEHFEVACRGSDSALQAMREARDQGLVKHLGITSHGQPQEIIGWLKEVPDFRTTTIYYNFLDRYCEDVVDYARASGVGVNVMGPLRGGLLVGHSALFAEKLPELGTLPMQQIALRFLLSHPGVTSVLSGMNAAAQVDENAGVADRCEPMTPQQRQAFIDAFAEFSRGEPLCVGCRYCGGACPEGLSVYSLMGFYQAREIFGLDSTDAALAEALEKKGLDARRCVSCDKCVEACPHDLPIPERMERLAQIIDELAAKASGPH